MRGLWFFERMLSLKLTFRPGQRLWRRLQSPSLDSVCSSVGSECEKWFQGFQKSDLWISGCPTCSPMCLTSSCSSIWPLLSSSIEATKASTSRSVGNIPGQRYEDVDEDEDEDEWDGSEAKYQESASACQARHWTWTHSCPRRRGWRAPEYVGSPLSSSLDFSSEFQHLCFLGCFLFLAKVVTMILVWSD